MGMGGLFVDEFEVVEVEDGAGAAHEVVAADRCGRGDADEGGFDGDAFAVGDCDFEWCHAAVGAFEVSVPNDLAEADDVGTIGVEELTVGFLGLDNHGVGFAAIGLGYGVVQQGYVDGAFVGVAG